MRLLGYKSRSSFQPRGKEADTMTALRSKRGIISMLPLIALFPLSACVSKSTYEAAQAENQQLQAQNQQLQAQVSAEQAQVARLQGAIKYTVNSDLLFKPGSWDIAPAGEQIMARMASQLASTQQNPLVVNGYTDNAPIGAALKKRGVASNLELSQKRAEAVMQFLISHGVKPELLSAKGYGEADPVAPNTTPAGRAQNRRVEITLASQGH
jgi:chemotaxis protein MotB